MVKRRNKNKAKRALVGTGSTINSSKHIKRGNLMETSSIDDQGQAETSTNDLEVTVQITESEIIGTCVAENNLIENINEATVQKKRAKTRVCRSEKIKVGNAIGKENDGKLSDEVVICPTEIDGEKCIDIQCGANEAVMNLSRLCVGSKGACIKFSDSWFTPNEFQSLSGRETAKDWKRSIRHNGRSLKLLIAKGLIQIKSASPKTSLVTPAHENDQGKTEVIVEAAKKSSVATEENKQCNQPTACPSDISKPKRWRKLQKQKSGTNTDRKKHVVTTADRADDIVDQSKIPVHIVDQSKIPVHIVDQSKIPVHIVDQSKIPVHIVDQSKIPVHIVDQSKIPVHIVDQSKIPVHIVDQSKIPVHIVDQSKIPVHIVAKTEQSNSNIFKLSELPKEDTRTEEERRLDEFVKSLRLTKISVTSSTVSSLKADDDHWFVKDKSLLVKPATDETEPEMPAFEKHAVIFPSFKDDQLKLLVTVDAFHTTVTPPPTPPSQQPDHIVEKVVDDRLVETFKSRLASPCDGLKLRINREKIRLNVDVDEMSNPRATITPKIESVLLQDALQAARKYKEQLQQNKNQSSSKTAIQVPHIDSNFKPANQFKEIDVNYLTLSQRMEKAFRLPFSSPASSTVMSPISSNTVTSPISSNIVTSPISSNIVTSPILSNILTSPISSNSLNNIDDVTSTVSTGNEKLEVIAHAENIDINTEIKSNLCYKQQFIRNGEPHFNSFTKSVQNTYVRNLSEMNFKEFVAIMTSAYGPLPFSADNKGAAMMFTALQKYHENHNMLNFINQGHPDETSSLLMISQQILLAMTQFYNMCNFPNGIPMIPQQLQNLVPRMQKTISEMYRTSSQKLKANSVNHVINCNGNQPKDLSRNKRKQIDIESDCALDLSIKKICAETNKIVKPESVPSCHGPLDFSKKTSSIPEKLTADIYTHLNRIPECTKRRLQNDHLTVNNFTNRYRHTEPHKQYENNRVAERSSASCRCGGTGRVNDEITSWSVERVCHFLKSLDGCGQYAKTFHDQGISGRLLPYLTKQHLTRTLGMTVASALTLMQAVDGKFREERSSSTLSPCKYCSKLYPQMPMTLVMSP